MAEQERPDTGSSSIPETQHAAASSDPFLMSLGLRWHPFEPQSATPYIHFDQQRSSAFQRMAGAVMRGAPFCLLIGPSGSGKTAILSKLGVKTLLTGAAKVLASAEAPGSPLQRILGAGRLFEETESPTFTDLSTGPEVEPPATPFTGSALFVDDADRLSDVGWERFRAWHRSFVDEHGPLSVVLAAADRDAVLAGGSDDLTLDDADVVELTPLDRTQSEALIGLRLRKAGADPQSVFVASAIDLICEAGSGNPGDIVDLCRRAIDLAKAEGTAPITADVIYDVLGVPPDRRDADAETPSDDHHVATDEAPLRIDAETQPVGDTSESTEDEPGAPDMSLVVAEAGRRRLAPPARIAGFAVIAFLVAAGGYYGFNATDQWPGVGEGTGTVVATGAVPGLQAQETATTASITNAGEPAPGIETHSDTVDEAPLSARSSMVSLSSQPAASQNSTADDVGMSVLARLDTAIVPVPKPLPPIPAIVVPHEAMAASSPIDADGSTQPDAPSTGGGDAAATTGAAVAKASAEPTSVSDEPATANEPSGVDYTLLSAMTTDGGQQTVAQAAIAEPPTPEAETIGRPDDVATTVPVNDAPPADRVPADRVLGPSQPQADPERPDDLESPVADDVTPEDVPQRPPEDVIAASMETTVTAPSAPTDRDQVTTIEVAPPPHATTPTESVSVAQAATESPNAQRDSGPAASSAEVTGAQPVPPAVVALVGKGDRFLALGDLASARLFYQAASDQGSAVAAMQMGTTFDPIFFQRSDVQGARPAPDEAIRWYRRSIEMGGGSEPADRLQRLLERLQRAADAGNADAQAILKAVTE